MVNVDGDFALDMLQSVLNKLENKLLKKLTDQQNLIKSELINELKASCEDTELALINESYVKTCFHNVESAGHTVESVDFVKDINREKVNLSSGDCMNNNPVTNVIHNFGSWSTITVMMFPEHDVHPVDFILSWKIVLLKACVMQTKLDM